MANSLQQSCGWPMLGTNESGGTLLRGFFIRWDPQVWRITRDKSRRQGAFLTSHAVLAWWNWLEIRPVSMGPPVGDVEHVPRAKDNWDPKMPLHILPGAVVRVNLAVFAYLPDLATGWEIQTSPGKDKNNHSAYAQGMRAL